MSRLLALICGGCGGRRGTWYDGARGDYCRRCYKRWHDAGYPASGPPEQRHAAGGKGTRAGRLEDYLWLLDLGCTQAQAQERLGVCRTTILRYERALAQAPDRCLAAG